MLRRVAALASRPAAPRPARLPTCRRLLLRQFSAQAADADFEPGVDDAPVLRIVRHRAEERARLLSELSAEMSSPEDIARIKQIRQLEPLAEAWTAFSKDRQLLRETLPLLADPDFRDDASADASRLRTALSHAASAALPALLLRASPTAHLGALLEVKAGVGGAEAALFADELVRMYERAGAARGWAPALAGRAALENGGVREATLEMSAPGAYDALRAESGVHRVQRVPATESGGRTHTSTVAVMVLPLAEESADETKDELFDMADVRVEVMRARGAGGQHVNKTESAIRLTHVPSGITVSMQDERSQHQNRRKAFQVLRARLMDRKLVAEQAASRAVRRSIIKGADRSEKVRTYNFAQDRVTDHRIGLTIKNVQAVLEGEALQDFLDALGKHQDQETLEEMLAELQGDAATT